MAKTKITKLADVVIPACIKVEEFPALETILNGFVKNKTLKMVMYTEDRDSRKVRVSVVKARLVNIYVGECFVEGADGKRRPSGDKTLMATAKVCYKRGVQKVGDVFEDQWGDESDEPRRLNLGMVSEASLMKETARLRQSVPAGHIAVFPDCAETASRNFPRVEVAIVAKKVLLGKGWSEVPSLSILE